MKICFRNRLKRRLSIHVQGLSYDVMTFDGSSTGYNRDSTTDDEIEYTWYADREGVFLFHDMADSRSGEETTNIHGLFGAIIVEPAGAKWYENFTKKKNPFAEQAVITAPGTETFREYVLFIQNGIRLLDAGGNLIQTAAESSGAEWFANRLSRVGRVRKVFGSRVHGDPATPVYKAYPGDRVIFRTMMPADKPRNVSLTIHGHMWREQQKDPLSREIPLQGGISIGNRFDMELSGGAASPEDYLPFI